ncbi:MAG: hypothetical protein A3E80_03390 [Chlamydiae bacterium RIFCSPHIGHO2_12_FULL_49_9]|nr:MAG: hypothetical protein A3E80_03390 [Chlamydiae bacterium RIFCSPHIGHO2_12_FULL_49_9]
MREFFNNITSKQKVILILGTLVLFVFTIMASSTIKDQGAVGIATVCLEYLGTIMATFCMVWALSGEDKK